LKMGFGLAEAEAEAAEKPAECAESFSMSKLAHHFFTIWHIEKQSYSNEARLFRRGGKSDGAPGVKVLWNRLQVFRNVLDMYGFLL
jgi:hypothetical protein